MLKKWEGQAKRLKIETRTLYLAYKDPRTPWYAKIFAACVVGYAFSPIDLIPDFIPVLGYLDDLILVPVGIVIALKLIPTPILVECRTHAREIIADGKPTNRGVAPIIIIIWLVLAIWVGHLMMVLIKN